jgi:hypothetical protein
MWFPKQSLPSFQEFVHSISHDSHHESRRSSSTSEHSRGAKTPPCTTLCHWNLQCTDEECKFAHQSPGAPMNMPVDVAQTCNFGVACKNTTCNLGHPSPALKKDHQAQSECRFYPNLPSKPRSIGWFDADEDVVRRSAAITQGLTADQIFDLVFAVDESRPRYEVENVGEIQEILETEPSDVKHRKCEKNRRIRHRIWQKLAHAMTPEAAHRAVESDPAYFDGKSGGGRKAKDGKKSSGQKPGKDEQLCSSLYTVSLLGIAVQSEHEGRKVAEERAFRAEARLAELTGGTPPSPRKRRRGDEHSPAESPKRRVIQLPQRLPPSPCTTAWLSPSPTPTLSSSSSFSH